MFETIIIDNCIVTKDETNGIQITPIRLITRIYPNINITSFRT